MQDYVEQMEFEGSSNRENRRAAMNHKKEFQQLEARWKGLREKQKREQLLTSSSAAGTQHTSFSGSAPATGGDREHLLTTERLERAGRKLDDGYRIALDTEQHGRDILNELQREREVLERSKNRLHHATTMLD